MDQDEERFRSDLKENELKMLRCLGLADTFLASVKVALHGEFPGVHINKSLIKRAVKRFKTEGRNPEDTNVQNLLKTRQRCLAKAGRFEINERPTLKGLSFQTKLQKELVGLYSDSVQIDTSHGFSKYIFFSMFPVDVDCFMKTVNFGCNLIQIKNILDVTRGLTNLKLKKMKVIMSDGSLALEKSAHDPGGIRVRCVKTLSFSFSSGAKGLCGDDSTRFIDFLTSWFIKI
eukprot:snap_masked-scaffold_1-processed-gene-0.26-mRNA-1 protein AED:1.00 eAED:1.00 QI:0/0/0/0/1/1/2/0/230